MKTIGRSASASEELSVISNILLHMSAHASDNIPVLEGEAAAAVAHRGGHVQIIAAAGSGKTEVVSQRVAALLAEGEPAESIVAFTFTEKAAAELKERIRQRVEAKLGDGATDQLGRLYVGTIHGYCFRLLQTHVPKYETYTPLDPNQLTNLLYRERTVLKLRRHDSNGKLFNGIKLFQESIDVVENELLQVSDLPEGDFRESAEAYYAMLDSYRFMSFGTQIVEAVHALEVPEIHAEITAGLRHLIVDEYQDVNPAQEQLIKLLSRPHGTADVVVVGDDDQAIYQWRGSKVTNIVSFADRYEGVTTFSLLVNRRSRPAIVQLANGFAQSIPERLAKEMGTFRTESGPAVSIAVGHDDEQTEADVIALDIEALHAQGVRYRDIAILVRGRAAYAKILDAFEVSGIPVQPGGRTGLFEQPEAAVFGATFAWLADIDWAPGRFIKRQKILIEDLLRDYRAAFSLDDRDADKLSAHLIQWYAKSRREPPDFDPSLVGEFYDLTALLRISEWDLADAQQRNRLGTVARFTNVLADYESVTRRSRRDPENPSEQVGGAVGNEWFYRNFALLLVNYANGNYNGFDGEEDLLGDSVALGTVHGAKGLEWPVVFLPSLTDGRFPSSLAGRHRDWLLPRDIFDAARYEGSDADERRLFYVALTRARDWVSLSSHSRVTTNTAKPSPYITEAAALAASAGLPTDAEPRGIETPDVAVTYSELAAYLTCPRSYLLRNEMGFMPPVKAEIGYGNAVHHVLRVIAEHARATGELPKPKAINDLLASDFFLPFANKPAHKEMREKARQLIFKYVNEHKDDITRTWATERPFELYLDGVVVSGRADVIYDEHDGVIDNLAIVDYKTATGGEIHPLQLQIYADAGRREGLSVGGAFIHDMSTVTRHTVDISEQSVKVVEQQVIEAADLLKKRDFTPRPERSKCMACDVKTVCAAAKLK
jgi:DNA helicase-2/ATP-dependent DNA helicase PcrA